MGNLAIKVENLGKMYRIGGPETSYKTFRDALANAVVSPFRKAYDLMRGQAYGAAGLKEEIWALKDVSFEVQHGEVVGIIGPNGAGKSTLLKVLSRITEPSSGYVDIYGRVGALLEVGTGFHPELTGRENIYLNSAILGMPRREIEKKFDEIVDFSGVEKFIDTPVKHYSSGMRLRLGFSVAAHLEPEILVVDEVLAVGDAEFQKKCLGKMRDVAGEGRTVLFVSHNMAAINNLCERGISLRDGSVQFEGSATEVVNRYIAGLTSGNDTQKLMRDKDEQQGTHFTEVIIKSDVGTSTGVSGQPLDIILKYKTDNENAPLNFQIIVSTFFGEAICYLSTRYAKLEGAVPGIEGAVVCHIDKLPLQAGQYILYIALREADKVVDTIYDTVTLDVVEGDFFNTGKMIPRSSAYSKTILIDHAWSYIDQDNDV